MSASDCNKLLYCGRHDPSIVLEGLCDLLSVTPKSESVIDACREALHTIIPDFRRVAAIDAAAHEDIGTTARIPGPNHIDEVIDLTVEDEEANDIQNDDGFDEEPEEQELADGEETLDTDTHKCLFNCGKEAVTEAELSSHYIEGECPRRSEFDLNNRNTCPSCKKRLQGRQLAHHFATEHGAALYSDGSKWLCHACRIGFPSETFLYRHLSTIRDPLSHVIIPEGRRSTVLQLLATASGELVVDKFVVWWRTSDT